MAWRAIAFDDTQFVNFKSEQDRKDIKQFLSVYCYDDEARTFLCEATASRFLVGLYYTVVLADDVSDERREFLLGFYCEGGPDHTYLHASRADAMEHRTFQADPEDDEKAQEEAAREHFQGNCPF